MTSTKKQSEKDQSTNKLGAGTDNTENSTSRDVNPNLTLPKTTREYLQSQRIAASFGNIITILMQSEDHKDRKLSELREIVVPALLNNQFRLAEAHKKQSGYTIPVGLILWAKVSDEVDAKLSDTSVDGVLLAGEDWASGENYWIIEAVGDRRFLKPLLNKLVASDFKDKTVKYRQRTENDTEIKTLQS